MHRPLLNSLPRRLMWILAALAMALPLCLGRSIASAKTSRVMIPTVAESCGDGILNLPGETCDPPGSPAGPNGNTCRADCTVCGDGIVNGGEFCDDGNSNDSDACRNYCFLHECADGILDAGETCDPPGAPAGSNGNICRANCSVCGEGVVNGGEACDDGNGINTDGCRNNCTIPVCGDGIVDAGEACDDGNTNNNDACPNQCALDGCGDGILEAGESCDPPGSPAGGNGNICREGCTVCGDGIVNGGEACDDGNGVDTDSCPNCCAFCYSECGDGIVVPGETCDPPGSPAGGNGNTCRESCNVCGDGIVNADEACDDGNNNDSDACPNRCIPYECGDGILDPGESCDPPGSPAGPNGNTCRADCSVCGDGILDAGEVCDDGNANNLDACANGCVIIGCGSGIILPGETCDPPGSPAGPNGNICRASCTVCGDGFVNDSEECDDANTNNTDACRNDCTIPRCGDGIVDEGETCDDGNTNNADSSEQLRHPGLRRRHRGRR